MKERFQSIDIKGYEPDRANNSKGEVVVNDSTVYCQSHRADRSIFSAEKIQDRWFKLSAAASVGASVLCTEVSTGHPHPSPATKKCSRNSSAAIFLVAMKRTLRCMKNEVAVGYEVLLRNMKNEKCALCFMAAKSPLYISAGQSFVLIISARCLLRKRQSFHGLS